MPRPIFFRDDDADRDLPQLRRLLDVFQSHGLPLNCAVIPATLTEDCASLLAGRAPWVDIHQHGWQHANHETSGRKCEFGVSRSYAQQHDDIACGKARLNQLLGNGWSPVFTPPWNRCNDDTYRVLADLHFRAVSQDRPSQVPGIVSFPAAIDLFTWKGGPTLKPLTDLQSEVKAAWEQPGPIGILLHHKVMNDDAFLGLTALIAWVKSQTDVTFHTFKDLLEAPTCEN